MSGPSAEDRVRELVRDLRPVRPVPRLRTVGAAALGLWAAGLAAEKWLGGPGLRPRTDAAWFQPAFLTELAGLALAALGFTAAALASAVPGREAALRQGLVAGAIGVLAALAAGLWSLRGFAEPFGGEELADSAACMLRAVGLGIASSLLACAFIVRACVRRPRFAAWLALAGGSALGAVAVHASCPGNGALHQLLGHTLAPLVAAAVLALPLSAGLRLRSQSGRG